MTPYDQLEQAQTSQDPQSLHDLVTSPNPTVRQALAQNTSLAEADRLTLALDDVVGVRPAIASAVPSPAVQALLVRDTSSQVRKALAGQPLVYPTQWHLARDRNVLVRKALALNPSLHLTLQYDLAKDVPAFKAALADRDSPDYFLVCHLNHTGPGVVFEHLAQDPNLAPAAQVLLSFRTEQAVLQHLGENPALSLRVLV